MSTSTRERPTTDRAATDPDATDQTDEQAARADQVDEPATAADPSARPGPRRRWLAVAAVACGLLLLGVGLLRTAPTLEAHGTTTWRPAAAAAPAVTSKPLSVAKGGYAVRVPEGTRFRVQGAVTRVRASDGSLVVTISPIGRTTDPALGNARVLQAMEGAYGSVRQGQHQRQTVGGRPAVASYGTVTTKRGAALRYVVVSVAGAKRGWSITAFARGDSDAAEVLPLVRAVVNGFRPLR